MASKTTYQLEVKLGATTSPSWRTTLGKAEEGLSGINSLSNKIMAGIAAGVTATAAAATIAISNAVETYRSFESEMATVHSISGASAQQFMEMKEAAMDAGRNTVFTATEAASALEYMSLAGWSVDESIAGLEPMLRLAAATGKELQTTSDLVTDSMSALGLEVKDLDIYLDKLVESNKDANATAEQMMQALVKTGGASRTLGASLDDTITSLEVLANNGLKGTEAGTALNAILVRLAGNTTTLKELEKLKVDLWNDDGTFVGLEEGLTSINNAMSELSDEQRSMSLKNVAGTHYYSQLAYLLDAVKEVTDENGDVSTVWKDLETQVADSTGALGNMYDITTDTLLFAQKRLTSAKEDMQLRIVDVFSDDAKDFLLWLSDKMPEATDSIVEFAEAHRGEFADALEKAGEGIEFLWNNGISAGQWIIKYKGAIVGGLAGIAAGFVTVKTALLGIKIAEMFTNPLSLAVGIAGTVITVIGAVAGAIHNANVEAVNANLAAHFGDISLSMKEIESVAQRIVSSDSLIGVVSALEEFDELESISDKMDDAVRTLEKLDWKVSIGIELTEGESEEYQRAIESFVENAQEYALQAQYSVSLSMGFAFREDDLDQSNLVTKVNQFYSDKYQELSDLGTQLNEAVTNAFNDGLLEIDEIETIANLQAQMADIEKELAVGEFEAQLSILGMDYSGVGLTADSFERLMEEIDDKVAEATESYKQAYAKNYSALTASYQGGYLSEEEYTSGVQGLKDELLIDTAKVQMDALQFLLNTVNETYADEIQQYGDAVTAALDKWSDPLYDTSWNDNPVLMWGAVMDDIMKAGPDKSTKQAIAGLLEPMEGTIDEIYSLREQMGDLDPETQDQLQRIISDVNQLRGITNYNKFLGFNEGDLQGLYTDVANSVMASDKYTSIKDWVNPLYEDLTGYAKISAEAALTDSLESAKTGTVQPVIEEMYAYSQEYLDQTFEGGLQTTTRLNLTLEPNIAINGVLGSSIGSLINSYGGIPGIAQNAEGGIYTTPILTTFAEKGPEAAVPLDGSDRAKSIWRRAGEILGLVPQGNRDQSILTGVSGGAQEHNTEKSIQVSYSPEIKIYGNASREDMQGVLSLSLEELREMIVDMLVETQREYTRVSFSKE